MAAIPANLCDLFARAVEQCPQNLAVDHDDGCLTYHELDETSTVLACELQSLGVVNGSPVLLVTAHGSFNLVAILAILKCGGCFVPIDRRTWSPDMIEYVCDTVDSPIIVNTTVEAFTAPDERRQVLHITTLPQIRPEAKFSSLCRIGPRDTACIIFTSGSTGRPKGVMISHQSLCLYAKTGPVNLDIAPGDRLLHILSVAFDACACMLFSTLGNCGTVVPAQPEDVYSKASSCTVMAATPSLLSNLPSPATNESIFPNVHTIILGGETATSDLLGPWIDAGVRVLAAYGATETTSMGCIHNVERDPITREINPSLIGGLMEQSPIWLLNDDLSVVEENFVEGEIIIAGDGVSQGYYKDKAKSEDRFICWNGHRVYRTGDYGQWVRGPAGDRVIEFRGRKDRTIKNRGFLVNLDRDVEDALYRVGASLGVKSVCAAATANGIIAVVTPLGIDTTTLLAKADQSMASYCLPYRIEAIEEFPLSSNGKLQHRKVLDVIDAIDRGNDSEDTMGVATSTIPEEQTTQMTGEGEKLTDVLQAAEEVLSGGHEKMRKIQGEDSFVAMGGSSLLAFKLVSVLRRFGLHIAARDVFKCRTFAEIACKASKSPFQEQEMPSVTKDTAVAQKLAELRSQACSMLGLTDEDFDIGPLTSLQLELAMPTLLDDSRNVNQVKLAYNGTYAGVMERAWRAVWKAEPVFRTEICLMIGCGAQIIHREPFRRPAVEIYKFRDDYEAAVREASMAVGLGCRLEFFAYSPSITSTRASHESCIPRGMDEFTIVLTVHHSLMDGISLKLLLGNIERAAQGWSLPCSPSAINANLGLIATQRARDDEARSFFSKYLKVVPVVNSSTERNRIGAQRKQTGMEQRMNTVFFETSAGIEEVKTFANHNCVSAACIYYTAWAMAISALERSEAVVVGVVFSNRATQLDLETAIGPYMSTLPLVIRFDAEETVADRLHRTMDDLTTIGEYAWARSDQVGIGRRLGNLLSMQPPLPNEHSRPPPVRVESLENSDFPLSLLVESNGNLRVMYDNTQFNGRTVRRVGEHFKHALHGLLHQNRVGDCMRINQLQEAVLEQAQQVRIEPGEQTVKMALERSIDRYFGHVAVEDCSGIHLTYGEIDRLTNVIAHHINNSLSLLDAGVVAIYGDGTMNWILGLLAILKTGRVYVPLDPKWPKHRIDTVCEKSGAVALLLPSVSQECEALAISGIKVLAVDSILNTEHRTDDFVRLPDTGSPDSDLVIIFTSGTTGTPKGIPTTNRAFLAFQSNPEATMFAAPGRRIAQFMSPAFDVCNEEIFAALLHGATLVLRDPLDPYSHLSKVNAVTMTPSVLSVLNPDDFPNLEIIYPTGEALTTALVRKFGHRVLLYNGYGPAECTISTSFERMIPGDAVTIGMALDTARMYILDDEQHQAPDGVRGEIYLSGVQVLRSYINASEQSALRILPDPWQKGDCMYRTGDYGSRGKDGRVTFMGRIDRQVKIRGFRVELAGVEHAIMSGPGDENISQCAALAINGNLAAFVAFGTPNSNGDSEERISRLRKRLGEKLLPSWVPQIIMSIEKFPRSANGKIDTKALEVIYTGKMSGRETAKPRSVTSLDVEGKLVEAWRQVLQLDSNLQLQETDDFFSLGGHSVLVMLLATRLTATFGVKVEVRNLLPTPSFGGQVDAIQQLLQAKAEGSKKDEIIKSQDCDDQHQNVLPTGELTELERQVWFQYQVATTVSAFNIANTLYLNGEVDVIRLVDALNTALASDPVLRSNMVEGPDGPKRTLRTSPPKVREVPQLDKRAEANRRFNLAHDELIRVHLIRNTDEEERGIDHSVVQLVIVTSHSIADLGTLQNLLRLTSLAYSGSNPTTYERPRHLDSKQWTRRPFPGEKTFWENYLNGHSYKDHRSSLFRRSFLPSPLATFYGASRTREFSGKLVTTLNSLIRRLGITHHQMGLAVAAFILQWLSGEDDIVLGAPNANRSSLLEREALGQFLNRLPVRVNLAQQAAGESMPLNTVLRNVRDSALSALANAIPFSSVLEMLGFPSGALHHPLFECIVTFHPRSARLDNYLQLPDCHVSASPLFANGSKFPLMLEWFEVESDRWSLHIEHDTNHLLPDTIDMIEDALAIVLNSMAEECTVSELRARLAELHAPDLGSSEDSLISTSRSSSRCSKDSGYAVSVEEIVGIIQGEMAACLDKGSEKLSPNSSFFSAGADSAAVIALRRRLQRMGFDIPVRAIFVAQSPLKIAEHVLVYSE